MVNGAISIERGSWQINLVDGKLLTRASERLNGKIYKFLLLGVTLYNEYLEPIYDQKYCFKIDFLSLIAISKIFNLYSNLCIFEGCNRVKFGIIGKILLPC